MVCVCMCVCDPRNWYFLLRLRGLSTSCGDRWIIELHVHLACMDGCKSYSLEESTPVASGELVA